MTMADILSGHILDLGISGLLLFTGIWGLYTGRVHTDKEFDAVVQSNRDLQQQLKDIATEKNARLDRLETILENTPRRQQ